MEERRTLGDTIRQRRLERGLTQEQLAELISTSVEFVRQSDISNLERGRVDLPRRQRLERIAHALDLSLGQLLTLSGWADADRHLAASLVGAPPLAAVEVPPDTHVTDRIGCWWQGDAQAVRIVTARFSHDHFDDLIDGYRSAAVWMATAGQGLCGFLLLVNHHDPEVISLGFWNSEAAMKTSLASLVLPAHVMRFGDQLSEPPSIEHHRLVERIVRVSEKREGRLAQLDRVTVAVDGEPDVIRKFHQHAAQNRDRPAHLDRAALLLDPDSGRPTTVSIWHPMDREAQGERHSSSVNGPRFPQLLTPADSHVFQVAVEI